MHFAYFYCNEVYIAVDPLPLNFCCKMAEESVDEGREVLAFALEGEKQFKHG